MNVEYRKNVVLAMECLVRAVNNEELLDPWLMCGVPDGDIQQYTQDEVDEYFIKDDNFADLMGLFLKIMSRAKNDGGLYVDRVVSK